MNTKNITDWGIFWVLFMAAEFSMLASLPYAVSVSGDVVAQFGSSLPMVLATQFARGTVFLIISIVVGLFLGRKVGLKAHVLESLFEGRGLPAGFSSSVKLSLLLGVLVGTIIFVVDRGIFSMFTEPLTIFLSSPPVWQRFLYSFYVGIVEELILRFFLVTLLVWITWKIKKTSAGLPTTTGIWLSILLASVLYGLGYVSSLASSIELNTVFASGIMILNVMAGSVFGWLYWKKGLEAAILANVTSMLTILVILGSLFQP
jgi:membrane protease YdiL (CAAX protease family)